MPAVPSVSRGPFGRHEILEPLRGIASMWVCVFHYPLSAEFQGKLPYVFSPVKKGYLGVAMFFAISGFCLTLAARRNMASGPRPLSFLGRRAWRIYPPFWASIVVILVLRGVTLACAPADPFWGGLDRVAAYGPSTWFETLTMLRQFRPEHVWFGRFGDINGAYWSLAIELQFYCIVAAAMALPRFFYWILGGLAVVTVPYALIPSLFYPSVHSGVCLAYWPWFACGVVAFWLLEHGTTPTRLFGRRAAGLGAAYAAFLPAWIIVAANSGVAIWDFTIAAATATTIWFASCWQAPATTESGGWRKVVGWGWKSLAACGMFSYSLYLIHNETNHTLRHLIMHRWGGSLGIASDCVVFLGTMTAAWAFYRLCERPFLWAAPRRLADVPVTVPFPTLGTDPAVANDRRAAA